MSHKLHILLSVIGAALMIAAPIAADAQSGRSGLRVVGPPLTKHSAGRSIDNVRAGMKAGAGTKEGGENTAKTGGKVEQKKGADAKTVRGK